MTDSTKNKIAEAFIAGLRAGNKSCLHAITVDDIVWSLPGSSTMSREACGVDAILKRSEILRGYGCSV